MVWQVGEVAAQLGLNPQTLYYYERSGLIPCPQRTEAGYRLYSHADLERLRFIGRAKTLGLSLNDIKALLQLKESQSLSCQTVLRQLEQKAQALQHRIEAMQQLQAELRALAAECSLRTDLVAAGTLAGQETLANQENCVILDPPAPAVQAGA